MAPPASRSCLLVRSVLTATASTGRRRPSSARSQAYYLDAGIAIDLDLSPQAKDAARRIAQLAKERGTAPATTDIRFGFDPIGAAAMAGGSPLSWPDLAPQFGAAVGDLAAQGFRGPFAAADGRIIHNAGGSEAQELAYALAVAVTYLRALEAAGIALDAARGMIYFRLAADADQLLTLAKFRALRKLWARVEMACGLAHRPIFVAAETAWRMMTQRDPYVNLLRETIAVVAAGLGGADAVTVLPFTQARGLPDRFARRLARNTQLLLLEESNLARVSDPAAGSGGIEDLTAQLCRHAWALFQEIETAGGAWPALETGLIQRKVAAVRAEREAAVARRKDALTGTSDFPNLGEAAVVGSRGADDGCGVAGRAPVRAPALPAPGTAVRSVARCVRPRACCDWRAAQGLSRQSRVRSPTSTRARRSPRISSKPAASKRFRTTALPASTR